MDATPALTLLEAVAAVAERTARQSPRVMAVARHPLVVRAGYAAATAAGVAWGAVLSTGRLEERGGVIVASGCPGWAFGRGGTTIGAVFLTGADASPTVLEHEAVHRAQWRRYGLALPILYAAQGARAESNRFEVEAGLEAGGYRRDTRGRGRRERDRPVSTRLGRDASTP